MRRSGHHVEAAQRFLEAKERLPVGSERWAVATAWAFGMLALEPCADVAKAGVVERRGAQGAVGERGAGGAGRCFGQPDAGNGAMRADCRLGVGASLGGGAQGGGQALRSGCGAAHCYGGESRARRSRGLVPQPNRASQIAANSVFRRCFDVLLHEPHATRDARASCA